MLDVLRNKVRSKYGQQWQEIEPKRHVEASEHQVKYSHHLFTKRTILPEVDVDVTFNFTLISDIFESLIIKEMFINTFLSSF
jgi:hypothetical protein